MKISKTRPKFHLLTKIEIKMTPLLVLFCYSLHLLFLSHLEAVLSTFMLKNYKCKNAILKQKKHRFLNFPKPMCQKLVAMAT